MDIHGLEESLSQEQIFKEVVSNCFFISSTRLLAHRNPRLGFPISKTAVPAVDFFSMEAIHKVVFLGRPTDREKSHLLVQKSTRPSIVSFFYSSYHNALRFSVHLALWLHAHLFSSNRQVSSGDLFKRQRLDWYLFFLTTHACLPIYLLSEEVNVHVQEVLSYMQTSLFLNKEGSLQFMGWSRSKGEFLVVALSNSPRKYSFGVILRGAFSVPEEFNLDGNMPN